MLVDELLVHVKRILFDEEVDVGELFLVDREKMYWLTSRV